MSPYYDETQVRSKLQAELYGKTQTRVAKEMGILRQNLSNMVRGGPLSDKALKHLGFRRVRNIYEKVKP